MGLGLESPELADELVVLGVRDLGGVVLVVAGGVVGDEGSQLLDALRASSIAFLLRRARAHRATPEPTTTSPR